jgi:hypothetical protein
MRPATARIRASVWDPAHAGTVNRAAPNANKYLLDSVMMIEKIKTT